ncbi:MAG: hypothetical protein ABIG61_16460 [Planctomycetota bacterium]
MVRLGVLLLASQKPSVLYAFFLGLNRQSITKIGINSWDNSNAYFKIHCLGNGTITEGEVGIQNDWHEFKASYSGDSPFYTDKIAGPNVADGNTMTDSGWEIVDPAAKWLTVSDVNAGEFAVSLWDISSGTYDRLDIRYIELIPATITE